MSNLLRNGDFEADWSEESSHACRQFPAGQSPFDLEVGNIFTPPGWVVWYRHEEGVHAQPEGRDARATNPDRMNSGSKGYILFTFSRAHDCGLYQQVNVEPGTRVRFTCFGHCWSNHKDNNEPDRYPHPDDPTWSEGAGFGPFFALAGQVPDGVDSAVENMTMSIGIDPRGGRNPFDPRVIWSDAVHSYNGYHQLPAVEAVAETGRVTVYMRSAAQWPFKHLDAYWDDAELTVVGAPPPDDTPPDDTGGDTTPPDDTGGDAEPARGTPREQYLRTYVLLPPGAGAEWARAVVDATWTSDRFTVGGSADDAGIGDLDQRVVIAVNPGLWGPGEDGQGLAGFYARYYPGVEYRPIEAASPADLAAKLSE